MADDFKGLTRVMADVKRDIAQGIVDATEAGDPLVTKAFTEMPGVLKQAEDTVAPMRAELDDDDMYYGLVLVMLQTLLAQVACLAHVRHERYKKSGDKALEQENISMEQVCHTLIQTVKARMSIVLMIQAFGGETRHDHEWHQK